MAARVQLGSLTALHEGSEVYLREMRQGPVLEPKRYPLAFHILLPNAGYHLRHRLHYEVDMVTLLPLTRETADKTLTWDMLMKLPLLPAVTMRTTLLVSFKEFCADLPASSRALLRT